MTDEELQGRLPWLAPDDLDPERRAFYDLTVERFAGRRRATPLTDERGRFHGPYNPMLFAPQIGDALERLGMALRFDGRLPRLSFEAIVLMIAVDRQASYEWYAHLPVALAEGLPPEAVERIRTHDFTPIRAILGDALFELVEGAMDHRGPSDEVYAAVEAEYGVTGIQEAIHTVAHYDEIALMMATFRIPLPPGADDTLTAQTDRQ
jgi:4-carboxymuconolactone decarboxylase